MQSLGEIFHRQTFSDPLIHDAITQNAVFVAWNKVVEAKLAKNASPTNFIHGVLEIAVASPVWANQLSLLASEIINKLNGSLKNESVRDIRFKVGSVEKEQLEGSTLHEEDCLNIDDKDNTVSDILSRILKKRESSMGAQRQRGEIECRSCGKLHLGVEDEACNTCQEKTKKARRQKIRQLIRQVPWMTLADARGELPSLTSAEFSRAKRDEIAYLKDEMEKLLKELKIEKPGSAKHKTLFSRLKNYAYGTVMLRTGKGPEETDEQVLKKNLSPAVCNLLGSA